MELFMSKPVSSGSLRPTYQKVSEDSESSEGTLPYFQDVENQPTTPERNTGSKRKYADFTSLSGADEGVDQRLKNEGVSTPLRKKIRIWQDKTQGECALHFPSTEKEKEVFASPGSVSVVQKNVGRGAQTLSVARVLTFPIDGDPPIEEVIKQANHSFSPQKEVIDPVSPHGKKYLNDFKRTRVIIGDGTHIGVVDPATSDLAHAKMGDFANPVSVVVTWFRDVATGVAAMHRQDILHRDLKPANIVIFSENGECRAELTDFGMSKTSIPDEHTTGLTPYFAPTFVWENIVKQRDRKGIQTKEADLFSLGRTMLDGGIIKLFKHYAETYKIPFDDLFKEMERQDLPLPENDRELLKVAENAEGPVIILFKGAHPGKLIVFPTQEKLGKVCQAAIERLKDHITPREHTLLNQFIELAIRLQNENPKEIPTAEEVEKELNLSLSTPIKDLEETSSISTSNPHK